MNRKPTFIKLAMILAAVSLLMLSIPLPVLAATTIGLSATSGTPGTGITVTGGGFVATHNYKVIFGIGSSYQLDLANGVVPTGGITSNIITIPNVPFDLYNITIRDTDVGSSTDATASFNLTAGISLNSSSGYVGDILLVSGAGFRANVPVFVFFNNNNIASTSTDTNGTMIPVSFTVPAVKAATYYAYATDGEATSSSVVFTVKRLLRADSTQGMVGYKLQLDGTGFDFNSGITIFWDNSQIDTTQAIFSSNVGTFSTKIAIPPGIRGSHTIKTRDNTLGFATVNFEVISSLSVDPASSSPGKTISLAGNGFRATTSVAITFNGTTITTQPTTITTYANGSFLASFVVPDVSAGRYVVKASDGSYSATATMTVASTITLSPSSGNVGTGVTVTGTGFSPGNSITLSYDTQTLKTITADIGGNISTTFDAPASIGGQHTISAREAGVSVAATAPFTMESTPPPAPATVSPANDSQADVQPTFSWSAVTDPSSVTYDLQIARDTGFSQMVLSKQGLSQASYQLSQSEKLDLAKKTSPYYWQIRAVDGASNSGDWTSPNSFYTEDSTPPDRPTAFAPAEGTQADVQPTFSWSVATDPSGVTYDLQIARDAGFSQMVLSKQGLSQASYQLSQSEKLDLAKKTSPYYWRIRAVDGVSNASDWTSPISFYTQDSTPPPAPVLQSPANSARAGSTPLFDWADVPDPSGVSYSLQVAIDLNFNQIAVSKDGLTKSEYQLTGTEKLTTSTGNPPSPYYWRVRATDGAQNQSGWTNANAFYVGGVFQGALLYVVIGLAGVLLLVIGIFIGMRIRPVAKPKA